LDKIIMLKHHNPAGLHAHPAFSQAVELPPGARLLFVGGQNGTDETGAVISNDVAEQTARALQNVVVAVEAAGGTVASIAKWTIILTDPSYVEPGFGAFGTFWGPEPNPPAITVQIVSGLANPDCKVEIEAVASL
jgi:enamine deaminase RidA (YjgF/YER057c/UK114 family)